MTENVVDMKKLTSIYNWADKYKIATIIAIIIYIVLVGRWASNRFFSFNATLWDLGIMVQAIWNTGQGYILQESVNLGMPISRLLVAHWELIYIVIAMFYRFIPSVPFLLYLQTAILAVAAYPLFKLALKKTNSSLIAFLIALSYLLYPPLHGANLFDFHSLSLVTSFLIFAFYYLDKDKLIPATIFVVLSLLCREDVSILVFMLGLYIIVFRSKYRTGVSFMVLSIIILIAYVNRSAYIGYQDVLAKANAASLWDHIGGNDGFLGILKTFISRPLYVLGFMFNKDNIIFLIKLFSPVLGMCFLAPMTLLVCGPTLILYLLSNWGPMHQIEYQYTSTLTPFIFLATVIGMSNVMARLKKRGLASKSIPVIIAALICLASAISTVSYSIVRYHKNWVPLRKEKFISDKLKNLPSSYSISTTARLGPHVAHRRHLYHFPVNRSKADLILLNLNYPRVEVKNSSGKSPTLKVSTFNDSIINTLADSSLDLFFEYKNVFCLQKKQIAQDRFFNYFFPESIENYVKTHECIPVTHDLEVIKIERVYGDQDQHHYVLMFKNHVSYTADDSLVYYIRMENRLIKLNHRPQFGRYQLADWPENTMVRDHLYFNKPTDVEQNTYEIYAAISSAAHKPALLLKGSF